MGCAFNLSEKLNVQQQQIQMQALADLLKLVIPQGFSSNEILGEGERGKIDEWKMSKFSGRAMMSLLYFRHRGVNDKVRFYEEFTEYFLRGSHSIDGLGLKLLETISIGLAGGGRRGKIIKKPGWVGRNITKRDWERKAQAEGSDIAE